MNDDAREPKWLVPLAYFGAVLLFATLVLIRDEPWTKGSLAGLVAASALSVGVFRVAGKMALGLHVAPLVYRPPVGEPTNLGPLERPLGTLLQFIILTAAAAGLALLA